MSIAAEALVYVLMGIGAEMIVHALTLKRKAVESCDVAFVTSRRTCLAYLL